MTINQPIISAGPTKQRKHVIDQPVQTHPVEPGGTYQALVSGVIEDVTVDFPTREGQVYFHTRRSANGARYATMYVGVQGNTGFVWVPAILGYTVDSYTGLPYDPIYGG